MSDSYESASRRRLLRSIRAVALAAAPLAAAPQAAPSGALGTRIYNILDFAASKDSAKIG